MGKTKSITLKKLVSYGCQKAKVDPKTKVRFKLTAVDKAYSLPLNKLLKAVIIQNWDPIRYNNMGSAHLDEEGIVNLLKNYQGDSGLVSEEGLNEYILYLKKFNFKPPIPTFNIPYIEKLMVDLTFCIDSPGHVFIYKESGISDDLLNSIFNLLKSKPKNNLCKLLCSGRSDDNLLADFFGCVKGTIPDSIDDYPTLNEKEGDHIVLIKDFQAAGDSFKRTIIDFINNKYYYGIGDNIKRESNCRIICVINDRFERIATSKSIKLRPDLYCSADKHVLLLYPLRYVRCDIPILIFLIARHLCKFSGNISFPTVLLNHWLKREIWNLNYDQLTHEIVEYCTKFAKIMKNTPLPSIKQSGLKMKSKVKKKRFKRKSSPYATSAEGKMMTFFKLLKLPANPDFTYYISNLTAEDSEPYDCITAEGLLGRPYFYYAFRYFNKETNKWDFNPDTISKLLANLSPLGLSEPKDLMGMIQSSDTISPRLPKERPEKVQKRDDVQPPGEFKYSLNEFKLIHVKISKKYVIPQCQLIHNFDITKNITLTFNKRTNNQFTFLLFLIIERREKEIDWLYKDFNRLKSDKFFNQVIKWCSIETKVKAEKGWWDDEDNDRKKTYVHAVNEKLISADIKGKLIEENPQMKGVYNLYARLDVKIVK